MTADHDLTAAGDPIGFVVEGWAPRAAPPRTPMVGRHCSVVPLDPDAHAADLFAAQALSPDGRMWTWMPNGPYADFASYRAWADAAALSEDPLFHTVIDHRTGKAVGTCSYLRIDRPAGVIEVGWIAFSPLLQRSIASTEAMYLMMRRVFDELGYRRYEWKCNALNGPSRAAAERLGLTYEGTFRQATIIKGRNRDTAWYAILDRDWPRQKAAFEAWLDPTNFDGEGRQKRGLRELAAEEL